MKLILHLGFPKTMSTSLQFGIFRKLHEEGIINLITWRFYDKNESLNDRPSSRLFNNEDLLEKHLNFSPDKINILSDESFTAPIKLRKNNYGSNIVDPIHFPALMHDFLKNRFKGIKVYPLVVIRNQPNLIYSQYVEEYNLKVYKNIDLVFDETGSVDMNGFEIYKFYRYYITLLKSFDSDHIGFFLFEDLLFDNTKLCLFLEEIIKIDKSLIISYLQSTHENLKQKNDIGYFTKDNKNLIPFFSTSVNNEIRNFFLQDNIKLSQLLKLDLSDDKYKYT